MASEDNNPSPRHSDRKRRATYKSVEWLLANMPLPEEYPAVDDTDSVVTLPARHAYANGAIRQLQEEIWANQRENRRHFSWLMNILRDVHARVQGTEMTLASMSLSSANSSGDLPRIPMERPVASKDDFNKLNRDLKEDNFRQQLVHFLSCVGGRNLDDFIKRVFHALFTDEISAYFNFRGVKSKEALYGTPLYEVITDAYKLWSKEARPNARALEDCISARFKKILDAKRKRRLRNGSLIISNDEKNAAGPSYSPKRSQATSP